MLYSLESPFTRLSNPISRCWARYCNLILGIYYILLKKCYYFFLQLCLYVWSKTLVFKQFGIFFSIVPCRIYSHIDGSFTNLLIRYIFLIFKMRFQSLVRLKPTSISNFRFLFCVCVCKYVYKIYGGLFYNIFFVLIKKAVIKTLQNTFYLIAFAMCTRFDSSNKTVATFTEALLSNYIQKNPLIR